MSLLLLAGFAKCSSLERQLLDALNANDLERAKKVINDGANVNAKLDADGQTALEAAARAGNIQLVELLLSKGAKPDTRGTSGFTAAEFARLDKKPYIANYLLSRGGRPAPKNLKYPYNFTGRNKDDLDFQYAAYLGVYYVNRESFNRNLKLMTEKHDTVAIDGILKTITTYKHNLPKEEVTKLQDHRDVTLFYTDNYAFRKIRSEIVEKQDKAHLERLIKIAKASNCPEALKALQNLNAEIRQLVKIKTKEGYLPSELAHKITEYK